MTANYGHFGAPAMRATVAIGVAALAHLVLPFGVIEFRGPAAPKADIVRFFEASDMYSNAAGSLSPMAYSVGLLFVGLALAGLGVTILMVLGYQPMRVDTARWMGASGGLLTVLGSSMALMPAAAHVGTGFSTFLGTVLFTEFRAQFWAVSPVIVALACLYALHNGIMVMTKVAANRDGIRSAASNHGDAVRWAAVTLAAVLFVPWSMGLLPDGVSDSLNYDLGDETAPLFFSAQDIQGATLAELAPAGHLRYAASEDWFWTGMAITLLTAAAWSAIVIGAVGTFMGAARSVGWPGSVERVIRVLYAPAALIWVGAGLFYIASWLFFAPRSGLNVTFLPGFWPVIVPIGAWAVLKRQVGQMKGEHDESADAIVATA